MFQKTHSLNPRKKALLFLLSLFLLWWLFALPRTLFDDPVSTVIEDTKGNLLGAHIANDGQWRFPVSDSLPDKFSTCVIVFEDKRFRTHIGVDVRSLGRAVWQNLQSGHIVSGASTISMQVIRMSRDNPPRTLWQKGVEILLAIRLEWRYSKDQILNLWASHAPFGGNVVGLETASWRYYGKSSHFLSWAEAATLAVLPNSPTLIHPGRNRTDLIEKRNRLLKRLQESGYLTEEGYRLSLLEDLPEKPLPLPRLAPHLLDRIVHKKGEGRWVVTIDKTIQENVIRLATSHQKKLAGNGIHNLAVLVVETNSGKVVSYLGNPPGIGKNHSPEVDLIQAPRSPGSLLKPILYSLALEQGLILPKQLLADVPCFFNGFKPENFYENYSGAVAAQQALRRSLNIPFVFLLQKYGVPGFHKALQDWQFSYVNQKPDHYGLSLILGGCEVNLWQAVGWYSSLGRMVGHHYTYQAEYDWKDWKLPHYIEDTTANKHLAELQADPFLVGAGAGWYTLQALQKLERPSTEGSWEQFRSSRRIAWKTGTSFGFRDAWAIGVTPDYTIGIWVGNADGEGRPGLIGIQAAAPLLFDILKILPNRQSPWFEQPFDDCKQVEICTQSGFLASTICPKDSVWIPASGIQASVCTYHQRIHLNDTGDRRVNRSCAGNDGLHTHSWFSLPPLQAHYYQARHPEYQKMPTWSVHCENHNNEQLMQWIYPRHSGKIQLPRDWEGDVNGAVFSITHQNLKKQVFWHLDNRFLGSTTGQHSMQILTGKGLHHIVVEDEDGLRLEKWFELVGNGGM